MFVSNNRGNKCSIQKGINDSYWEYTLDHLIEEDMPALIKGILKVTKKEKLSYVGHSQGTTQFMLALAADRSLTEKIECFIGLGPILSLHDI